MNKDELIKVAQQWPYRYRTIEYIHNRLIDQSEKNLNTVLKAIQLTNSSVDDFIETLATFEQSNRVVFAPFEKVIAQKSAIN